MPSFARNIVKEYGGKTQEGLKVPIEALYFDPKFEKREELGDMDWIVDNIRREGFWIKEPIEVRPHKDTKKLEIVDGRRRYRACLKVKESGNMGNWDGMVHIVPQLNMSDEELVFKTLISNNENRKPFTFSEEGEYFKMLISEFNLDKDQICERIGKSPTYVLDRLAFANLDSKLKADITSYIKEGKLSVTGAAKIAKLPEEEREKTWKELKSAHNQEMKKVSEPIPENNIRTEKINGKEVQIQTDANGREKVVHPVKAKTKIKVKDVIKGSKRNIEHISIKVVKQNLEKCKTMYEETKSDFWEGRMTILQAVLENRVIDD